MIKDKIQHLLLLELYNNWVYEIPINHKDYLLFDFYAFTLINPPAHRPDSEGGTRLKPGGEFDKNLELEFVNAKERLCNYLVEEFKYNLLFSLAAEFRHVCGKNYPWTVGVLNEIGGKLPNEISRPAFLLLIKYLSNLNLSANVEEDYLPNRQESYDAIKKISAPPEQKALMFKQVFLSRWWDIKLGADAYGGKSWAQIADAWVKLFSVSTLGDKIVLIDHIYDLQHNNGSVLTKVKEYSSGGTSGDYKWLKAALDFKRDIKDSFALYNNISPGLRGPFAYAIYHTEGKTLEQHLKLKAKKKEAKVGDVIYLLQNTPKNVEKIRDTLFNVWYSNNYPNTTEWLKTNYKVLEGKPLRILRVDYSHAYGEPKLYFVKFFWKEADRPQDNQMPLNIHQNLINWNV